MKEIFEKNIQTEELKPIVDPSIWKKKSSAKSFSGWLIGKMRQAKEEENADVLFMLKEIYDKYHDFETRAKVRLRGWKGKSSFQVIKKPDTFEVITFSRFDQDSEPKEIRKEISKKEINEVVMIIKDLNVGNRIKTKEIAEILYGKDWKDVFSTRCEHTQLNLILRLLDYYDFIKYRGGYTEVLDKFKDIQIILK